VMQMILKRVYGFELHYERSGRYDEWADTDESYREGSVSSEVAPGKWMYEIPKAQPRKQFASTYGFISHVIDKGLTSSSRRMGTQLRLPF